MGEVYCPRYAPDSRGPSLHVVLWNVTPQVENGRVHSNNPNALRASCYTRELSCSRTSDMTPSRMATFRSQSARGSIDYLKIIGGKGIYQLESVRLDAAACLSRRAQGYHKLPRTGLLARVV